MQPIRLPVRWLAVLVPLAAYASVYAVLRTERTLVRTGLLFNERDAVTGKLTPRRRTENR